MNNEELKEFSALLKVEREAKKITLKEISDSSKINIKFLEAIESGDFDVMPEVYIRAFLKTYAKYIGLDPEKVAADFDLAKKNKFGKTAETPLAITVEKGEKENSGEVLPEVEEKGKKKIFALIGVIIVAVLFVLGVLYFLPDEEIKTPEETSFEEILKENTAVAPPDGANEKVAEQNENISVRIDAVGQCWIGVRADADTSSSQYMLSDGSKKYFTANDSMRIVFGNPAGVKVLFNDKELKVQKKKGEVTEVIFRKDGATVSPIKVNKNE